VASINLNGNSTITELAEYYLENVVKGNYADSTYKSYRTRLDNHILPEIGAMRVRDLKKVDVQNLIFGLSNQADPVSANTARLVKSTLNSVLNLAVDVEITDRNVAQRVILPKQMKYRPQIYTELEIRNLLDVAKDTVLYIPILLAVKTGLRRSEILALQWHDISFCNESITIRKTATGRSINAPKTRYSYRTLQPPKSVLRALERHCRDHKLNTNAINGQVFVVSKEDGSPYNPSYISRMFNELLKTNNLPPIRFHDLRHAYATYALEKGMNVKELSSSLGHNSAATTLDNYVHINDKHTINMRR
jgi:integrase